MTFCAEVVLVLSVRSAVDPQQERNLRAAFVSDGIGKQSPNSGAVWAVKFDTLG